MNQRSDGRRGIVFGVFVVVLAAVGLYLTMRPASSGSPDRAGSAGPGSTAPATRATQVPAAATTAETSAAPSGQPGTFDVLSYLPLSKDAIAASGDLTQRFIVSYATYRYDEDPVSYAERLKTFTTLELGSSLTRSVTSSAQVQQNRNDQVVSQGSARLKSIRDMTENSITWVVTATQRIAAKSGARNRTDDYAVTLTQVGEGWKVYDMQPASSGQEGDSSGSGGTG